jgi:DNA processing protein
MVLEEIRTITISFPNLSPKPVSLYYLGYFEPKILDSCVAVVGSRRMTEYGRRVIEKLVPSLVENNKMIVSGLMYGTDQAVHKETLKCGGKTIAVLGWGIRWKGAGDEERRLAKEIVLKGGAVISEWKDQRSTLWTFPQRDRIMAALATDIYVVEAATKSGALITADWGRKLEKQIWAVPGPITSKVSEGTNALIANGLAKMWLPQQQLSLLGTISNVEIYTLLQNEPLSADEIARKTGRSVSEIGAELTVMMLRGEVVEKEGKYYIGS